MKEFKDLKIGANFMADEDRTFYKFTETRAVRTDSREHESEETEVGFGDMELVEEILS